MSRNEIKFKNMISQKMLITISQTNKLFLVFTVGIGIFRKLNLVLLNLNTDFEEQFHYSVTPVLYII